MSRRFVVFATLLAAVLLWPAAALAQNYSSGPIRWNIEPGSLCPGDSVRLRIQWCSDCVRLIRAEYDANHFLIVEVETISQDSCLSENCPLGSRSVVLGRFAVGNHQMIFGLIHHVGGRTFNSELPLSFSVRPGCEINSTLPFVDRVDIYGPDGGPICGGQPIVVSLKGRLPSDCHSIRRVELFHPVYAGTSIRLGPPIVRVLVDDGGCYGRPCLIEESPWGRELILPPLPADNVGHGLLVEVYQTTCSDSFPERPLDAKSFPFTVQNCGPPTGCLITKWAGPLDARCDAFISKLHPARLTLKVASDVPLAGLQGQLRLYPGEGLRISSIQTTGAASTMFLSWQVHPDGHASWVLFAKNGSTIPASQVSYQDTLGEPILHVFVETYTRGAIPPVSRLFATEVLGSDPAGDGVYHCPVPANVRLDLSATICADRPCDANGDGVSDVRDLVRMVNCLHDSVCMDSTRFDLHVSLDCDGDQHFTIADVICCALAILRHHAPPDSSAQPGDVRVELGLPVHDEDAVSLPVTVLRGSELGASLLQLRYPSDRYVLEGVDYPVRVARLALHSNEGDDLALGLVKFPAEVIVGRAGMVEPLDSRFVVRLRLRPGMEHGGRLDLVDGQFSTPGGNRIDVHLPGASMPIVPPVTPTISPARPNPFARETRFSVDLPRAAAVDVTIHDLSGRRVAVLFQGELPAGRRDFTWAGAIDRGGLAADGVYFLRLSADGRIVSRKVVVLRSP